MFPSLQLGKKRPARRPQKLASASPAGVPLLYLKDACSGSVFLVDTGVALSVFPHSSASPSSGPPLVAADGRSIPSWGCRILKLDFNGVKFSHKFVLAGVSSPIIGLDFLRDYALLMDTAGSRILTSASGELSESHVPAIVPKICPVSLAIFSPALQQLLEKFPTVFEETSDSWPAAAHDV